VKYAVVVVGILFIWQSATIIRVENQRYALTRGLCTASQIHAAQVRECLTRVQSRSSPFAHLYSALFNR
jgi:hypothetical protein